jgi:cellulose synthase/poly-beta-1,6-N-acetylglucosamine synthase-like glycosyltransferase
MDVVFWASVLIIGYVYAGYPLLLALRARASGRPPRKGSLDGGPPWPSVSIIVAARNEASRLPDRIENLLALPYDGPREIIVVSDGSTDGTTAALAPYANRIRLVRVPGRGKPSALNAGVETSTGEILVFADARQWFSRDALRHLVANFADPQVGGATGELVLDCETNRPEHGSTSTIGDGVGLYWKYEKWLRKKESLLWSTLGATGAIYALRRSEWRPLPAATLLDDVLAPMRIVLAGRRIVFDEHARAFDRTPPDATAESRRKTRTLAGNYQILLLEPRLLVPIVNPVWLEYLSHKIGRLLVPWALLALLTSTAALVGKSWFYTAALTVQLVFYALAGLGAWLEAREHRARSVHLSVSRKASAAVTAASLRKEAR